ncbi:trans-aconitate 2-methyltransferase [Arthrobacter sp. JSM 101049]|uniref:class I SAM-dependent methyltransferase n=1 Tax=Arthrobacter sp. JSM 101049 TaxID=929097 RepID=UPI00356B5669
MTQHGTGHHDHDHHPGHGGHEHGHHGGHDQGEDLAGLLELDGAILKDYLVTLTGWVADHAPEDTRTIIDVGAGTGTGSLALARCFPTATVHAVDQSPAMLERVDAKARAHGLDARIRPVHANLDEAWPELPAADLVWAASSLHEFADPKRALREIRDALAPQGLLAVVEMDALPRYLPQDLGIGRPGLEDRCHEVIAARGWNHHPDWAGPLRSAGYDVVAQRQFDTAQDPAPEGTGDYAAAYLSRIRTFLADHLDADDLATLDRLLDPQDEAGLRHRTDLKLSGTRTAWLARRA